MLNIVSNTLRYVYSVLLEVLRSNSNLQICKPTLTFSNVQVVSPTEYIYCFRIIIITHKYYLPKNINELISVMVNCCVFFKVRNEFLNVI
jgi:hypothetical protein